MSYNAFMEPMETVDLVRQFFEDDPHGATAAYLFGSRARGTSVARSDVDIGVLYPEAPPPTFEGLPLALEADLEKRLGLPTEVVVLNWAPVDLRHRVLRDGILVLDRNPSLRIRFEVQSRNEYFDLEPILKVYRKARS